MLNRISLFRIVPILVLLLILSYNTSRAENDPFSIIILPDTQHYTDGNDGTRGTYNAQTQWIVDNADAASMNIKFVIHVGDITNDNTIGQWLIANTAHLKLDNANIPYSMLPGNHDSKDWYGDFTRDTFNYNTYFGPSRFNGKSWYKGNFDGTNDYNYSYFESENLEFMVVSLAQAPTKEALCWADKLISDNPTKRVIIATHCYQGNNGYKNNCACRDDVVGTEGKTMWDELVANHNNVFMVLSGHVSGTDNLQQSGLAGNKVYEILTDYQSEKNSDDLKSGNGWLRKLTFVPAENRIYATSITATPGIESFNYSEYASSPSHADHTFNMHYSMNPQPLDALEYEYNGDNKLFSDMEVNSYVSGQQKDPEVVMDPNGDFVVVWADDKDENGAFNIRARGLYAGGCERIADFTVNSETSGQQKNPSIAMDSSGNFVVTWADDKDGNGVYQIYARGFNADFTQRFADKTVNSVSAGQQKKPQIAMATNGDFVIVWEDDYNNNGVNEIFARGFYANGTQKFADIRVNSEKQGHQTDPKIAMDSSGNFVVTWENDKNRTGVCNIFARGFYANGTQRFADFRVNTTATAQQLNPDIAMDSSGNFVVTWADDKDNNGTYQIYARGFYAAGGEYFDDEAVNSVATGQQKGPAIAMDSDGDFVVVWRNDKDSDGNCQIFARGFNIDFSTPLASIDDVESFADSRINQDASAQTTSPVVALGETGIFFTVWQNDMNHNDIYNILVRGVALSDEPLICE
ncbi:metallophosphoesterase [Thermodesulfobacteriota bacterium]